MSFELTDRAVIAISGPEARDFLQGLVTNDIAAVAPGNTVYAALLTPQGKVLFDFLVFSSADGLLLDCRRDGREALIKRLTMYKLRAKVEIAPRDDLAIALDGAPDPRLAALGLRGIVDAGSEQSGDTAYLARRLELGVPEGADFGSGALFAMETGLDELHGISFSKGCYVGQELTARMKHRGKDRKRLLPVLAADGVKLPAAGTAIVAGDAEIGSLTSVYDTRGFALIRLDRLAETGGPFAIAGVPVTILKPDWLFT